MTEQAAAAAATSTTNPRTFPRNAECGASGRRTEVRSIDGTSTSAFAHTARAVVVVIIVITLAPNSVKTITIGCTFDEGTMPDFVFVASLSFYAFELLKLVVGDGRKSGKGSCGGVVVCSR
jgi:hypothetical protein